MILLPINEIQYDEEKVRSIENIVDSTFRLITFSRAHLADDLLNAYISKTTSFKELLSIKNAQMEAQNEQESEQYAKALNSAIDFITSEIKHNVNLTSEVQLFQLFRIVSSESHLRHPNRYRNDLVQIGKYLCPDPKEVPGLVNELFHQMSRIENPLIKCIYFHHELIRIHPFVDGNGRTVRMAKNWMLMFELCSPIFISNNAEKKIYISTLENSFLMLNKHPGKWNQHLNDFFNQELERILENSNSVLASVEQAGNKRKT